MQRSQRMLIVLLATLVVLSVAVAMQPVRAPAGANSPLIAIDAGHGGPYSNANANGLREKNVNLSIAYELRRVLIARGYRVVLVRTSDWDVELHDIPTWNWSDRSQMWFFAKDGHRGIWSSTPKDELQGKVDRANAAGADLYVSIHNNGSVSRSVRGTESYGAARDPNGVRLASLVNAEIVKRTGLRNRGYHRADFYVLRWSNMPAVLVEGGFISNPSDASLLGRLWFRRRIAEGIANGIRRYFATDRPRRIYPRIGGASPETVAVSSSRSLSTTSASTVILASADDPQAAMCAAPLAAKLRAPLLFARRSVLPTVTAQEIARLQPSRVILLAPKSALDSTVAASALATAAPGAVAERIEATSSAAAALAVAARYFPTARCFAVAAVGSRVEQLAASVWAARSGAPLIITPAAGSGAVEPSSMTLSLAPTSTALVLGAPDLSAVPARGVTVVRIAHGDQWYNAAHVNRVFGGRVRPVVANSTTPATAILAAVHAARSKQPLVLLKDRILPAPMRWWVTNRRPTLYGFTVLGTDAVTTPYVDHELAKAAWY